MRTIFFGTPEIAVPALRALAATTDLVGVVCQPDRPSGRGLDVTSPAVKRAAAELGIPVHQPTRVKEALDGWVRSQSPDVAVVMAYGRILPKSVLDVPRLGCVNLHASLLPKFRGAAPIQWALIRGETETGMTLMQMDEGMDTGPVFCERRVPISTEDTAGSLAPKLAALGAAVVTDDLPRALSGDLPLVAQDSKNATFAPPLTRADGVLDWTSTARALVNRVRGLSPKPGAFTMHGDRSLKVLSAAALSTQEACRAGTVVRADRGGVYVACGMGTLEIVRAQVEGRKPTTGPDLVNGRFIRLGDVLGSRRS